MEGTEPAALAARTPNPASATGRKRLLLVFALAAVVVGATLGTYLLVIVHLPGPSPPLPSGCEPFTFKPGEKVCIRVIENETKDLSVVRIETSVNVTYNLSLLWITWRAGADTPAPGYNGTMHFLILYKNGTRFDCAGICFAFGFSNYPFGFKSGDSVGEEIAFFVFLADQRSRPPGEAYDPSMVDKVRLYFTRDDNLAVISGTVEVILLYGIYSTAFAEGQSLASGSNALAYAPPQTVPLSSPQRIVAMPRGR